MWELHYLFNTHTFRRLKSSPINLLFKLIETLSAELSLISHVSSSNVIKCYIQFPTTIQQLCIFAVLAVPQLSIE